MRSCCNHDGDIVMSNAWHLREQRFDHDLPGLSACDVAYGDCDFLTLPVQVSQGWLADRLTNRLLEQRSWIRRRRDVHWFNYCRAFFRKFGEQPGRTIVQM